VNYVCEWEIKLEMLGAYNFGIYSNDKIKNDRFIVDEPVIFYEIVFLLLQIK